MDDAALARIEQQRVELEANIAKLRNSLRHWQTLEIDYESLREEFTGISDEASVEDCLAVAKEAKPELVDDKELGTLLRDNNGRPRQPSQLADLLSKRIEYVDRNVQTVRKQLSGAERKRNALLLAEEPDHRDEAGLPLAEITEELDDSGNVVSSKVANPESTAPQLIDALKKAGVTDLKQTDGTITKVASGRDFEAEEGQLEPSETAKTDNTTTSNDLHVNAEETQEEAQLRQEMFEYSRGIDEVGAIVAELDLEEEGSDISYDEQDDMLELDSDLDHDEEFDEDDSEDEIGKSTGRLSVPRGYRKRMEELQEKLGLKNLGPTAGFESNTEESDSVERPPAAEAARKAALARHNRSGKSNLKSSVKTPTTAGEVVGSDQPRKKKVAFSADLDIAPGKPAATVEQPQAKEQSQIPKARPTIESVVERTIVPNGEEAPTPAPATPKKQSRFKAARDTQPQTPMFAPPMTLPTESSGQEQGQRASTTSPSRIIAANLVERPSPKASDAPDPDDFPEEIHRQEIAREYQMHRMKRIQSQDGGFVGGGEDDNYGEMITPGRGRASEDPAGRKVSRFKAARINR
ncbi:Prefoldin subunit-domain-containing protein [Exophiala viscosa]|uniref:Prefoldin subunit-domain-containing protein n=1 Tax=Exophiala viscosa TaxID=2486360 RepID=A0AAN6DZC8_9EURO|nr:Prefoldin subunit-domain-containing protein [Exophiala viscosa]